MLQTEAEKKSRLGVAGANTTLQNVPNQRVHPDIRSVTPDKDVGNESCGKSA
jgi:hypothetical protein